MNMRPFPIREETLPVEISCDRHKNLELKNVVARSLTVHLAIPFFLSYSLLSGSELRKEPLRVRFPSNIRHASKQRAHSLVKCALSRSAFLSIIARGLRFIYTLLSFIGVQSLYESVESCLDDHLPLITKIKQKFCRILSFSLKETVNASSPSKRIGPSASALNPFALICISENNLKEKESKVRTFPSRLIEWVR
jgi:hypothetical protein